MVLMHKTCIFTKPVFTDVNTRYARGTRKESRVAAAGKERGRTASHRAVQRHLFILPRRMDKRTRLLRARMYARTSARGVYLTGARTCDAESADPPRRNGRRRRGGVRHRRRLNAEVRPVATVRADFSRARNAPRGTHEITSSGSAKLRDSELTEANPPEFEREKEEEITTGLYYRRKAARYYWEMDTLSMIA